MARPALLMLLGLLVSMMGLSLGPLLLNYRVLLTTLADHGAPHARARRAELQAPHSSTGMPHRTLAWTLRKSA